MKGTKIGNSVVYVYAGGRAISQIKERREALYTETKSRFDFTPPETITSYIVSTAVLGLQINSIEFRFEEEAVNYINAIEIPNVTKMLTDSDNGRLHGFDERNKTFFAVRRRY